MKRILFLTVLLIAVFRTNAVPVDVTTATKTAKDFSHTLAIHSRHKAPSSTDFQLIHTELSATNSRQAAYYIFNTSDSYIIVAGDDRSAEVLAYGDSPLDMNKMPKAMKFWLNTYKGQMEWLLANPEKVVEKGARRSPSRASESVRPLLTALWDQDEPYNNQCPVNSYGLRCVTGCAATSLAMVFHYWKFPINETPSVPGYLAESINQQLNPLPPITFDWDNMLDRYHNNYSEEQANAVAWLMRYVGQAERMDYSPSSSGSYGFNILQTIRLFGYDTDSDIIFKSSWWDEEDNYTDDDWSEIMQNELFLHRPMVMCAYGYDTGGLAGHAFNVDGYDGENDLYHVNWGWSGSGNGFFAINAFRGGGTTFNIDQQLLIGIEPPVTVPTIKCNKRKLYFNAIAEKSFIKSFAVKQRLLDNGVTLTLDDETGYFSIDTDYLAPAPEQYYGQEVHVTYTPMTTGTHHATITLSSEGADDVIIDIEGKAVLETYTPNITAVNSMSATSFMVNWNDRTPIKNVDSYQLEIVKLPFSELRFQEVFDKYITTQSTTSDWSSRLDELTHTSGWTGSKVYPGNMYVRLGNANSVGWLETPATDMLRNNGLVTVKVTAKSAGSDASGSLKISCGDKDTTILVTNTETEYCVLLPCNESKEAKVRLMGKRILIYEEKLLAGDDYSPIDFSSAEYRGGFSGRSRSGQIDNLEPGNYNVRLQAFYTDGTQSQMSNSMRVHLDWAIGDVNRDGEIGIADINALIDIALGGDIADSQEFNAGDLNGDGEVGIADINTLINLILNGN